MSDSLPCKTRANVGISRQSTTDKAESTLKPNSQKSTLESATDSAKGTGDSIAGSLQPKADKSATQKATDSVSSGSGHASNTASDYAKSAQDGASKLAGQASDTVQSGMKQAQDALGLGGDKK
ncbi:hypothetical protein AC578_1219 [Pseudocercospora eumusae]|uniref:Uncharacterized protein n=1 Tax=Pseudocercospora eumusae TaxID=321146 RepID=A0A139HCW1_9PEZI|nr:hypothetical protein AC578_1219 [Pseudocercospora eumusae]